MRRAGLGGEGAQRWMQRGYERSGWRGSVAARTLEDGERENRSTRMLYWMEGRGRVRGANVSCRWSGR